VKDEARQILAITYSHFHSTGGEWPTLGYVQRELNRRSEKGTDVVRAVRRIPTALLKPLPTGDHYPALTEVVILTAEGIRHSPGSGEDIGNLTASVRWLVRLTERANVSAEEGLLGVRFTIRQLADAVSLSVETDRKAIDRLLAILQSEGLMHDGGTRTRP
jgi:hypothetical protein